MCHILNGGKFFTISLNPGAYPMTVDATDTVVRACQVTEFETNIGVAHDDHIVRAVDPEWLE